MHQIKEKFTSQQRQAVNSPEGEFVVKAGAGTGKTRVLVYKFLNIYENQIKKGLSPVKTCDSILTVTFTNRAAKEMIERLSKIIPEQALRASHISTIDSFCTRFLRENAFYLGLDSEFRVIDQIESKLLFKKIGAKVLDNEINTPLEIEHSIDIFLNDSFSLINSLKQNLISPEQFFKYRKENVNINRAIYLLYKRYEEYLNRENMFDFGKLLFSTYNILKSHKQILKKIQNKFKYVLIDEYQDTNPAQVNLMRLIASPHNNYFVVGDEQQSIYGFRGAVPDHIVDFFSKQSGSRKVVLNSNFRSPEPLTTLVNKVFEKRLDNYHHIKSSVKGKAEIELFLGENRGEEAQFVARRIKQFLEQGYTPNDIVVLFRGVKNCREYEEELKKINIPSITVGGMGFYQQPEIKDILSFLLTIDNSHMDREILRVMMSPCFGMKDSEISHIAGLRENNQSLYKAMVNSNNSKAKKITDFVDRFRKRRKESTLVDLINEIMYESGLIYTAVSKTGGKKSRQMSNLKKFLRLARRFESRSVMSSFTDFAEYLRQLEEADIVEPEAKPKAKGVVHLMTIHQAKGLEFPVVFIANVSRRNFPTTKRMDRYHFLKEHGLIIRDRKKDSRYNKIIKDRLYSQHHQEERRLLYVAMTRMKKNLIISGQKNNTGKISKYLTYFLSEKDKKYRIKKELQDYIKKAEMPEIKLDDTRKQKQKDFRKIKEDITKKYSNLGLPEYILKDSETEEFSVTQLQTYALCPAMYNFRYRLKIPEPPEKEKYSPTIFGSSVHRMLQEYYNFGNIKNRQEMKEKITSLILASGVESREFNKYYSQKTKQVVEGLFNSDILAHSDKVICTEKPFILKMNESIIKGIVDRVDRIKGGAAIVDYKTSKSVDTSPYELQMGIYKDAVQKILNIEVKKITLAFVRKGILRDVSVSQSIQGRLEKIINGIKNEQFDWKENKFCKNCPYKFLCQEKG